MGLILSQDGQVQQLYQFRKLDTEQESFEIPEKPENRRQTDRKYWIAFLVVFVVLIPFLIYTLIYSEPRILTGSDNCGNFCGYKNKKYDEWACSGKDYTEEKYQLLGSVVNYDAELFERSCVNQCPENYQQIFYTCIPRSSARDNGNANLSFEAMSAFLGEVLADIGRGWWAIILSTFVSALLCYGTMCLFRYAVDFLVWFILLGSVGICGIASMLFFYAYTTIQVDENSRSNKDGRSVFLTFAITFGIIFLVLLCFMTCMMKRVKLIIQLFKEAGKAIFDIPSLLMIPIWSALAVSIVFVLFVVLEIYMLLSGKLTAIYPHYLEYVKDVGMTIALLYNLVVYIWITEFLIGAQYIVIAGAVSSWFFTRNKNYLNAPVWTSFTNLTRFHMGTLAIGSLIITIMTIIRAIIRGMANNNRTRWIIECCMANFEEILRFLSKNAYIQTAMHGQPFFKSGKRAAKLLVSNACNVMALNSIGDFILAVAQLVLIVLSGVCAFYISKMTGVEHFWAIAVISIIISCCMANTFFATFQATIDSIFICFCEDTILNDGMARPYFMSKGLMQFIEDSKAIMPKKE